MTPDAKEWAVRDRTLRLGRPLVMGIVNVTPDSFSDGGRFLNAPDAVSHARRLVEAGADILDVGGESTRPGSQPVPEAEEWRRVGPVIEGIHRTLPDATVSVDTMKPGVAQKALAAGAHIVNDVSAMAHAEMASVVARGGAGVVLMHMKGEPATMQQAPTYANVVDEVMAFLKSRSNAAQARGVARNAICVDPGLGFGKRTGSGVEDNAVLLRHLSRVVDLGYPVLVGASRKTFTGNLTGAPKEERLEGSLAAAAVAVLHGAHIVRAHDVKSTRRVVDFVHATKIA